METDEILNRIKEHRKKRGFSYETMAHEMNTSTAAYRKIEMNQTKLTLERLYQIAQILDVSVSNLLDLQNKNQLSQINKDASTGYLQQIDNFHSENKEKSEKIESLYDARLKDKDLIIEQLQKIIEFIRK